MIDLQWMALQDWLVPQTALGALAALVVSVAVQWLAGVFRSAGTVYGAAHNAREVLPEAIRASQTEDLRDPNAPPAVIQRMAEARRARRMLRPEVAVRLFLEFLRERGHTGWFAAEHIDELWIWYCDLHQVVPIDAVIIRSELAAIPALRHRTARLNTPEFVHVKEALGGRARAAVYFVPNQPISAANLSETVARHTSDRTETGRVTETVGGGRDDLRQGAGQPGGSITGKRGGRQPGTTPADMKPKARTGGRDAARAPAASRSEWREAAAVAA